MIYYGQILLIVQDLSSPQEELDLYLEKTGLKNSIILIILRKYTELISYFKKDSKKLMIQVFAQFLVPRIIAIDVIIRQLLFRYKRISRRITFNLSQLIEEEAKTLQLDFNYSILCFNIY